MHKKEVRYDIKNIKGGRRGVKEYSFQTEVKLKRPSILYRRRKEQRRTTKTLRKKKVKKWQ